MARIARRILYIQYTNPAGYPPLEHSSRILANTGWQVLFLGTGAQGAHALRFPPHPQICVRQMPFQPAGWRQKLHYLRYCAWTLGWALRFRPQWIYASDPLSCPAALLLSRLPGVRVLYHEHDSPGDDRSGSGFQRLVLWSRRKLAQRADLCVLPNELRAEHFSHNVGLVRPAITVWNCPRIDEVAPQRTATQGELLTLYYHGNIGPHLLPLTILDAMATLRGCVQLIIVGYETIGTYGYLETFRKTAESLGIAAYVRINPAQPRHQLWFTARTSDIGLVLLKGGEGNINLRFLTGASNKAFDYLACGMVLLVPDLSDWRTLYVDSGYGLACDPSDPLSIAQALRWLLDHPAERRAMGERGRQRILSEWNYEAQFAPVLASLEQLGE